MRFSSALPIALAAVAAAQTHTACDPTKKTCPNDPALSATFETDFTKGAAALEGWTQTAGNLTYSSEGALFTINQRGDAPTIQTNGFFLGGYVEVKAKAATGQGIVSSIVLESDDLDEVDWEFLGTTTTNVQTNYYGKGNTTTYDRMIPAAVTTPQETVHTYALNWTEDALVWMIDGTPMRTLNAADAVGGQNYPQTPMNLRIGIWAGGDPDNSPGTIEWAGGKTDYTKCPFTMTVQSVKVINYSPGTEYQYTDKSGDWKSIKVVGAGNTGGNAVNSFVSTAAGATATGGKGLGSIVQDSTVSGGALATGSGGMPGGPYPTASGIYVNGTTSTECGCGVATVTVTAGESGPSSLSTIIISGPSNSAPVPVTSMTPPSPSGTVTYGTVSTAVVPSLSYPASSETGGLITDTAPAPSVPATGVPVSSNGTATLSTGIPQFTGAAQRHGTPLYLLGAVAGLAAVAI